MRFQLHFDDLNKHAGPNMPLERLLVQLQLVFSLVWLWVHGCSGSATVGIFNSLGLVAPFVLSTLCAYVLLSRCVRGAVFWLPAHIAS